MKKQKPKPTRATQVKLREILKKVNKGWQRYEVIEYMTAKYGLSETWCNSLYYQAFKLLEEKNPFDELVNKTKDEALSRANSLYKESLEKQDYKTATKCLEMMNKLNGLYTEKHEIKEEITTWTYEYNGEGDGQEQENSKQ